MGKAFRFIHAADLHLDSPFRGVGALPQPVQDRLRACSLAALERLTELALWERPDFVVISGDVYDARERSLRAQLRFQQTAERWAGERIPVFVIHGNHDPLEGGYSAALRWPETVRFFGCDEVESEIVRNRAGEPVARVSGISFRTASVTSDLSGGFRAFGDGLYHVGVLHTNADGDARHDNYAPCRTSELVRRGVDYWALGHIHTRAVLHASPWIVYPGNAQGRHFRETGERGCYMVEVSEAGDTRLTFHPLDEVRFLEATVDIAELSGEQELKEALEQAVDSLREQAEGRAVLARLMLTGRGALHAALRRPGAINDLLAGLREQERYEQSNFVWVEALRDATGAAADRERLMAQPGFLGELLRCSDVALLEELMREAFASFEASAPLRALLAQLDEAELRSWLAEAEELAIDALIGESAEAGWRD